MRRLSREHTIPGDKRYTVFEPVIEAARHLKQHVE